LLSQDGATGDGGSDTEVYGMEQRRECRVR